MNHEFHPEALAEFEDAARYYEGKQAGLYSYCCNHALPSKTRVLAESTGNITDSTHSKVPINNMTPRFNQH